MATEGIEKILTIKIDDSEAIKEIAEYRKKVDELKVSEKQLMDLYKKKLISDDEYQKEMAKNKIATKEYNDIIRILNKEVRNGLKNDQAKVGSLKGLRAELSNLTAAYDSLSREERENAQGTELLNKINTVTKELKEAEAATQRYYRNVGNYTSAWDGLGMSIQQVARELPALSMGFNTFFLAISNNLPIMIDQISLARKEYAALVEKGEKATPVWKQVIGSIFSWQTALVAAVTVLTMYGKDIVNFVGNLFKSKKGIDAVAEATKALADARTEAMSNSAKELSELQTLYKASQDTTRSMKERIAAVDELQSKYPTYFGNMDKEGILAGQAADSYTRLKDAILEKAKAQAIQDRLAKEYAKTMDLQIKLNKAQEDMEKYGVVSDYGKKKVVGNDVYSASRGNAMQVSKEAALYNQAAQDAARYNEQLAEQAKLEEELLKLVDAKALTEEFGGKGTKAFGDRAKEIAQMETDAIREMEDALLNIIKDNQERQRKEIELSYDREIEDLKKRLATEKDLTAKAREAITETIKAKEIERKQALDKLSAENVEAEFKEEYERQLKLAEARLAAQEAGSAEELELKKKLNDIRMEEELRQYADDEEMKLAIRAEYLAKNAALDKSYNDNKVKEEQERAAKEVEIEQAKYEAMSAITGGLVALTEAIGESDKAAAVASKVLALAQIAIETGKAIAKMVSAESGKGILGLGTMATGIATILANIATAIKTVKGAKFATGGDVSGEGTATSDSIPAMLSNGESVLTAAATNMFAPILSAFNQAGGGVPIYGQQTGNQAMGEDMLARAFAKGVASLPSPVVSVEEINSVGRRVEVIENISSI